MKSEMSPECRHLVDHAHSVDYGRLRTLDQKTMLKRMKLARETRKEKRSIRWAQVSRSFSRSAASRSTWLPGSNRYSVQGVH